jgi:hypothetical protein
MIEKYIDILSSLRKNEINSQEFHYKESTNSEGHISDENHKKRFQLLIALQYDRTNNDQPLLKELLEQEIIMHKKASFQGLFPSIKLNAFLLSIFKNPENVWLFVEAKIANFDTHCGFDYEYMVSAGIEETFHYVNTSENILKVKFYEYVGGSVNLCDITKSNLEEWFYHKSLEYNDSYKPDNIEDEIQLAIDLDENDILNEKINQWKKNQENWNEQNLNELYYYDKLIGNINGQIIAKEKLFILNTTDWDKAVILQILSELYLKSDNPFIAWNKIKESQTYLKEIKGWKDCGLGRSVIESAFDFILYANDPKDVIVNEAFDWAIREIQNMENLHLNLLEKTAKASDLMGDLKSRNKFSKILTEKRKNLDEILNPKNLDEVSNQKSIIDKEAGLLKSLKNWWNKIFNK